MKMSEAGTFPQQFNGFSGPARAIIDRGESSELVLPSTHGDATVEASEETYEVTYDESGNVPTQVFSLGQRFEITYPMKHADLEVFSKAALGGNYTLSDTADPDEAEALVARKTATPANSFVHKKPEFSFDIGRLSEPPFDWATGDAVTRTEDRDIFSIHFPNAVALAPNGAVYTFHNGESVYTLRVLAIRPINSTDDYVRIFNTDLAKA
jgi:YD repeat-containing protein